ncbi:hypothetical protein F511_46301 [Dorcoceras hygrometricum]|uniref:Uncharacterized protein n=1 Tax=Dorcoceras hygrometricum TaxID=472368 RepID=A0A2Z6ZTV8_9LAMI|nr:hypothetical protein F511_46301 [Dorcoceras hygrometricum]
MKQTGPNEPTGSLRPIGPTQTLRMQEPRLAIRTTSTSSHSCSLLRKPWPEPHRLDHSQVSRFQRDQPWSKPWLTVHARRSRRCLLSLRGAPGGLYLQPWFWVEPAYFSAPKGHHKITNDHPQAPGTPLY